MFDAFLDIKNDKGPRCEPCRTPEVTTNVEDILDWQAAYDSEYTKTAISTKPHDNQWSPTQTSKYHGQLCRMLYWSPSTEAPQMYSE